MSRVLLLLLFVPVLAAVQEPSPPAAAPENVHKTPSLRVMLFNLWYSGERVNNGSSKIAKHILRVDPDIVAIQEVYTTHYYEILELLNGTYVGVYGNFEYPDVAILTKHKIVEHSYQNTADNAAVGCQIELNSGHRVNMWSLHLFHASYGPYAANNKQVTNMSQIMAGEINPTNRVGNVMQLLAEPTFQKAVKDATVPLIVAGDLNVPSHLDWVESTKHLHGDWVVEWPATKLLQEGTGLVDTFREMHPDPLEEPGNTWSTVQKSSGAEWSYLIPEPQDRLDMVYKKGSTLRTVDSFLYSGDADGLLKNIPYHVDNDYPSDHYAVITDFEFLNSMQ